MPTTVLDLEFEHLPCSISDLESYTRADILLRLRGRPVARFQLPVEQGTIAQDQLEQGVISVAGPDFWDCWLDSYLDLPDETPPEGLPSVTVAVCTRDRPEDLRGCLEGVLRMADAGQDILVVDNHPSSMATRDLVSQYPRVRYVCEDRPGLDIARNRALRESHTEIVAFVDDDAVPDPSWLHALQSAFTSPQVLCVTGLTMPAELESESQEMFERYSGFGRGFTRIVYSRNNINPLAAGRVGAGANMALRRSALALVGPFDEALDAGTLTQSGGDTEMFSRILRKGYQIVYEPAALNWHRHRRTWSELRKVIYGYGVGVYAFWTRKLLYEGEPGVLKLAWGWFWSTQLPGLLRSLLKRDGSLPVELVLAELRGCLAGPRAYIVSRRKLGNHREALV